MLCNICARILVSYAHGHRRQLQSAIFLFLRPTDSVCFLPWHGRQDSHRSGLPVHALPIAVSADCHSQFTQLSSTHLDWMTAQSAGKTLHDAHLCKVRWSLLSSSNSLGNRFHCTPEHKRKRMPLRICLGLARFRPACCCRSKFRMVGSISCHRSSTTSQMVSRVSIWSAMSLSYLQCVRTKS